MTYFPHHTFLCFILDKVVYFFELFFENKAITSEAFKAWRETETMGEKKCNAIYRCKSFFKKLDEAEKSE
jgi:hypothetical protein